MDKSNNSINPVLGRVFDIQRMCIHDGPGIRTTVFLKGCVLRCAWCHNPEGLSPAAQLAFSPVLCAGCGYCFRQCPHSAHIMDGGEHRLDRALCQLCFSCVEGCCSQALERIGRDMTVGEVMSEVVRDRVFYEESGGGLTVSGGEPLMQFAFTWELLGAARSTGIHTCLETCGFGAPQDIDALVPLVDVFLYDIKETDPERHRAFTGKSNAVILDNLRRLNAAGAAIILRCVMIPEVNLRDSHLRGIADIARSLRDCRGVHVMGYHSLGEGKKTRLGTLNENRRDGVFSALTGPDLNQVAEQLVHLGCAQVTAF